jgi:hypothetical protein
VYDEVDRGARRIQQIALSHKLNPFELLIEWLIDDLAEVVDDRYGDYAHLLFAPDLATRLDVAVSRRRG